MSDTNDQLDQQLENGGAPEGGAKPTERQPTPRELAMESIRVRREGEEEQTAATPPASNVDQQLEQQTNQPVVLADGLDRTMVKVKIDGEERLVPVADVVARFQKNEAADKRLAEATALLQQAQATQKPPAAVDAAPTGEQTTSQPPAGGQEVGQTVNDFITALYDGDQEKAAKALQDLMGTGRSNATPIDPSSLATQLAPAVRQQLADESALERFLENNEHIANDPHLLQVTVGYLDEEMRSGKAYSDALEQAGRRTADWMARLGVRVPKDPDPTTSREHKLAQKGQIDEIRPASISAANTVQPPETASDVIAQMRKARGLPV